MKKIFVYYSLSGNGDFIAEQCKKNEIDIIKLEVEHPLPEGKFLKFFLGGMHAFFHHKPKLKNMDYDLSNYDHIIIGIPIWNGTCATPINSFFNECPLTDKTLSIIAYSGSGKAGRLKTYLDKKYTLNTFISLKEPLHYQQDALQALLPLFEKAHK